jgi:hypothetical protein
MFSSLSRGHELLELIAGGGRAGERSSSPREIVTKKIPMSTKSVFSLKSCRVISIVNIKLKSKVSEISCLHHQARCDRNKQHGDRLDSDGWPRNLPPPSCLHSSPIGSGLQFDRLISATYGQSQDRPWWWRQRTHPKRWFLTQHSHIRPPEKVSAHYVFTLKPPNLQFLLCKL